MGLTYVFIFIMFVAVIFVTYLFFYKDIGSPNYANFMMSLTFLATFFPLIILINQYQENNTELEKQKSKDIIRNMETDTINFEMLFMNHYPFLSRLYQQIYKSDKLSAISLPDLTDEEMDQRDFFEVHLCSIMFQYIENTLLTADAYNIMDSDPQFDEWVFNWKTWFQSDIVQSQWMNMYTFYGANTQNFINEFILPK